MKVFGNLAVALGLGLLALGTSGCPKDDPAQAPIILAFTGAPAAITDGETSTLSWETQNAVSLSLVDATGATVDIASAGVATGSIAVTPSATTEYTLTATGGDGTVPVPARATITVAPADVCGDGSTTGTEVCDDGNTTDGDYCAADCSAVTGSCGDSTVQSNETCDDGNTANNDYCAADCQSDTGACGDNTTQTNEACDDGNVVDGDYCSADCQTENGACGDGTVESFEACDDGNTVDGDYCDATCENVTGACGDSTVQSNEDCDDGAETVTCDADCTAVACGDATQNATAGEVCDDGNTTDGDGCRADCLGLEVCGDTLVDAGEACDDGNTVDGDYCAADCLTATGSCGDSTQQSNEACDDGNTVDGDGCRGDCMGNEVCGDTLVDVNEVCDDGNTTGGDGCRADCMGLEVCGDALVDVNEECDDGNNTDGDGCSAACLIEGQSCTSPYDLNTAGAQPDGLFMWSADTTTFTADYAGSCGATGSSSDGVAMFTAATAGNYYILLSTPGWDSVIWGFDATCDPASAEFACVDNLGPGGEDTVVALTAGQTIYIVVDGWGGDAGAFDLIVAPEICGDGLIVNAETCDDGNTTAGDGCDATCQIETGYVCPTVGQACRQITCGDGFVDGAETCDDTNTTAGDGCDATCQIETGYVCPTPGQACRQIICGDGIVDAPEACDDGGNIAGDGCDATCVIEAGFACPPAGGACHAIVCGDGVVDAPEQCDDGGTATGDGCGATCMWEGDTCADFYDLTTLGLQGDGTYLWASDTNFFNADYDAGCSNTTGPADAVANFVAPFDATYIISMDGGFDGVLYVWDAACDTMPVNELVCQDGLAMPETVQIDLLASETINIIVDGWGSTTRHQGAFTLTVTPVVCGDGTLTAGIEACDDGNTTAGDGCSATCTVEAGWDCPAGAACTFVCGNGTVDASETCDDGNTTALDGCSAVCLLEPGFDCLTPGSACTSWALPAAAGDLVITEVMQNPASVADASGEWFEIHNPTTTDWQLMGLVVTDDTTTTETFTVDLPVGLPAGGYAVFAVNGDAATNGGLPAVDFVYTGFAAGGISLGNGTDGLVLTDSTGATVIDTVIWDNGATFPDPIGASMALASGNDATTNDVGTNWCTGRTLFGAGDHASPGLANPGYDCATYYDGFDTATWTGWVIEDGLTDGFTWQSCTDADLPAGLSPFTFDIADPPYACVNSRAGGTGIDTNEGLISPSYDFTAATAVVVSFESNFQKFGTRPDQGSFEYSLDGGVSYITTKLFVSDSPAGGSLETFDLSAALAGQATVTFRFGYVDGATEGWFWAIDNFNIVAN